MSVGERKGRLGGGGGGEKKETGQMKVTTATKLLYLNWLYHVFVCLSVCVTLWLFQPLCVCVCMCQSVRMCECLCMRAPCVCMCGVCGISPYPPKITSEIHWLAWLSLCLSLSLSLCVSLSVCLSVSLSLSLSLSISLSLSVSYINQSICSGRDNHHNAREHYLEFLGLYWSTSPSSF